jgi:hypothetical protein
MAWKVKRPVAKVRGASTGFITSMEGCARVMAEETSGFIVAAQERISDSYTMSRWIRPKTP